MTHDIKKQNVIPLANEAFVLELSSLCLCSDMEVGVGIHLTLPRGDRHSSVPGSAICQGHQGGFLIMCKKELHEVRPLFYPKFHVTQMKCQ